MSKSLYVPDSRNDIWNSIIVHTFYRVPLKIIAFNYEYYIYESTWKQWFKKAGKAYKETHGNYLRDWKLIKKLCKPTPLDIQH